MKKFLRNSLILLLALTIPAAILVAGGAKEKTSTDVTVVRIGTEGAYPPYNYVRADGVVDGYDIAVARAVDELIPELSFEYVPTAWEGIFVALEGGDFDAIASNLGKNAQREAKYLFSKVPYLWGASQIVFKAGRTDIHSLADLAGKKVAAGIGTNTTTRLEEYIAQSGTRIEIVYTDGNIATALQEIDSGRVDATLSSIITTKLTADELGIKIDGSTAPELGISPIHLLFVKNADGERYRDLVDVALQKLLDNGTLKELSIKYLGKDYSTRAAVEGN